MHGLAILNDSETFLFLQNEQNNTEMNVFSCVYSVFCVCACKGTVVCTPFANLANFRKSVGVSWLSQSDVSKDRQHF